MESLGSYLKRCFQVHATSGKVSKAVEGLNEGQVSVIQSRFQTKLMDSLLRLVKQRQGEMEDSDSFVPVILVFEEDGQWCNEKLAISTASITASNLQQKHKALEEEMTQTRLEWAESDEVPDQPGGVLPHRRPGEGG